MKQSLIPWFLALGAIVVLSGCATLAGYPLTYSAEAIEGRVVDADTKQPIEGVVVTANWQLSNNWGANTGQMMAMETVTDKDGKFSFSAWGPKLRSPGSILTFLDPQLVFFKSGYDFESLQNEPKSYINKDSLRKSQWNGKTIPLKLFKDDRIIIEYGTKTSAYAKRLGSIESSVSWAYADSCDLKYIPRMIVALHLQEKKFREQGIYSSLPRFDYISDESDPDRCGVRKILRKYLP